MHYFDLVYELTKKEIKLRYKNSILGYFWSIGSPLAHAFVYLVCFKLIMKIRTENFAAFLITALFAWQWFSNSVASSSFVFLGNASLIKKTYFPRYLLVYVIVLQDLVHFLIAIPVIAIFLLGFDIYPTLNWIFGVPLIALSQFFLTSSISLIVSSANLFFRDMQKLIEIFLHFAFYLTPVLYDVSAIPERFRHWLYFHPIALLMISWRDLFFNGFINWTFLGVSFIWAAFLGFFSYFVYKKLSWRFAEVL